MCLSIFFYFPAPNYLLLNGMCCKINKNKFYLKFLTRISSSTYGQDNIIDYTDNEPRFLLSCEITQWKLDLAVDQFPLPQLILES